MFVEKYLRELRKRRFSPQALYFYFVDVFTFSRETLFENRTLARSTLTTGLGFFLGFFAASIMLSVFVDGKVANEFFLISSLSTLLVFAWLILHLSLIRDIAGRPLQNFNAANTLSLLRLLLVPGLFIFIVHGYGKLSLATYLVASLSDVFDGIVARRFDQRTRLGLMLDHLVDIFFNSFSFIALYIAGFVNEAIALLVILRYALLLCGAFYIYVFRGPVRIQPTAFGKFSGLIVAVMVSLLILTKDFLSKPLADRILGLLGIGLVLIAATNLIYVVIMGIYNLKEKRIEEVQIARVAGEKGAS
ncbi:MAG: CDP-alcohol phosphatidyltransferase family protein [Candidatus Eisenbacteria bacterium]|nr:CDP-alcohol phosphatidyltransferase family protein [Candidatus Eisenbacteria bacterium]